MDGARFRSLWTLDPDVVYLNHGSFGACPRAVLETQAALRARLERQPVHFFVHEYEALLDGAREALGRFVDADPDDLAFVPNATAGVNTVLRSLRLEPGDELLTTDHEYNASRNALEHAAAGWGARVVVAPLPWPVGSAEALLEPLLSRVTERTRLCLVDHVTSVTALVLPVERLVHALRERGVETLVDGAHAPGMLPLSLRSLGAAYYTGNCHKWMCAPKGAAFLHVRRDLQEGVRPLSISHGFNSPRKDRSRFRLEFDWTGTGDPTPALSLPHAIEYLGSLLPGGWPALREDNRQKVIAARRTLCARLGVEPPCPESMLGSMAALPLPDGFPSPPPPPLFLDPLQERLLAEWRIEVPVIAWPKPPHRHVRVSAQLYNRPEEYARLGDALVALLGLR